LLGGNTLCCEADENGINTGTAKRCLC